MASGMEMAMSSVFKWLGLKPEETLAMFFGARDAAFAARDATARCEAALTRLEAAQIENRATLELLLKLANGDKPNGHTGTEHGGGRSDDHENDGGPDGPANETDGTSGPRQ